MEKEHVNISYRLSSVYLKLGEIVKAASEFQKLLKSIPNHFPTRVKLVETYISLANEKRQSGSYAGYKEYLRCALEISIEGLKYPFKSVWLFRFIGRILTLFMKNGIICSGEILDTCLNSMNLFIRDTDENFLQDCNISFASVSF
jgi:tetratricopeptide (TPR) repeat protein